jgi:putative glutamine amidotransferase
LYAARDTYVRKLIDVGLVPVFVASSMPRAMIDELYDECVGVLLMGGRDIDASHYGEENHEKNLVAEPARDELEMYILSKVLETKKPFLGICRGCQALAVATGGTLHQHTPDLDIDEVHHPKKDGYIPKKHSHVITVVARTKLANVVGTAELPVHCAHHQSIKSLGDGFQTCALSTGGVIEAIESTDTNWFCFGVQFHPEVAVDAVTDRLFEQFSQAIL